VTLATALLKELVVAYAVGVGVVLVLLRLRVPVVVGFLVAGVLLGPHGLGLVRDVEGVSTLADVGVVILLFTIGVEMNLSRLLKSGVTLLGVGLGQMALATLGTAAILAGTGAGWGSAIAIGLLLAASSTTLLLRVLGESGEAETPHGRLAIGVSLVQDLCVVPTMILLPLLAGAGAGPTGALLAVGKAALVLVGTVVLARWVVPRVFELVVSTRSRELFALAVILLCLGTAFLAGLAGLSLALGAFLGGVVVSGSPYAQQVLGEIKPLRDGLAGLFFIGVGMLLDAGWVAAHAPTVLGALGALVLFKLTTAGLPALVAGFGLRISFLTGVALAQVGEFSFVLVNETKRLGLTDDATSQMILAVAVLSMAVAPFVYRGAVPLAPFLDRISRGRVRRRLEDVNVAPEHGDHVILLGYGLTGRNVAAALAHHGRPFVVVEMNPETVRRERAVGVPILFGDAGHAEVLEKAGVHSARLLVVAINDPPGARRVVDLAKRMRPELKVLVRTRFAQDAEELLALGADDVVPEELETSIELFARALKAYDLPQEAIERSVRHMRLTQSVRSRAAVDGMASSSARALAGVELETHVVGPGAPADGKTIAELELGRRLGVTVVGVTRAGDLLPEVGAATRLEAADVVVVVGKPERLVAVAELFRPRMPPAAEGEGASEGTAP
jgi:CPA2 family monovalent cation:H+ antiporter-2